MLLRRWLGPDCVADLPPWHFFSTVYSMAQASKAILPRDVGGPWGKRIGVSVGGTLGWGLVVGAYVTGRVSSSDWLRYSLVVLNWCVTLPSCARVLRPR